MFIYIPLILVNSDMFWTKDFLDLSVINLCT